MDKKTRIHITLVVLFSIFLILPTLDMFFSIDKTPQRSENRFREKFPAKPQSIGDIKKFFSGFDVYYSDNFGFRNMFIWIYGATKYFIFHVAPTDRVILGKDGWIFLARQGNVEAYRNLKPYTEAELQDYAQKLLERKLWSEQHGIQYIYMVGPDSLTLNPEHLPDWVTKVNPESHLDQIIKYAKEHVGIDILDVRPALFEGKKRAMISHRTDSHWNLFGGYLAYREIVKRIQTRYPEVKDPVDLTDYEFRPTHEPGLDLTVLAGLREVIPEIGENLYYKKDVGYETIEHNGLHFTTVNNSVPEFPIAIVTDSMGGNVIPYLARQFSKIRVLWGYLFETEEILRYHPKVIIHLVIERSLVWGQIENPPEVKAAAVAK